jgi:hypothetical protein
MWPIAGAMGRGGNDIIIVGPWGWRSAGRGGPGTGMGSPGDARRPGAIIDEGTRPGCGRNGAALTCMGMRRNPFGAERRGSTHDAGSCPAEAGAGMCVGGVPDGGADDGASELCRLDSNEAS